MKKSTTLLEQICKNFIQTCSQLVPTYYQRQDTKKV